MASSSGIYQITSLSDMQKEALSFDIAIVALKDSLRYLVQKGCDPSYVFEGIAITAKIMIPGFNTLILENQIAAKFNDLRERVQEYIETKNLQDYHHERVYLTHLLVAIYSNYTEAVASYGTLKTMTGIYPTVWDSGFVVTTLDTARDIHYRYAVLEQDILCTRNMINYLHHNFRQCVPLGGAIKEMAVLHARSTECLQELDRVIGFLRALVDGESGRTHLKREQIQELWRIHGLVQGRLREAHAAHADLEPEVIIRK